MTDLSKGEIKAATIHELGIKFDDMLEAAKQEIARNEGAKTALLLASRKVSELLAHVDKDMDEGLFSDIEGPLLVAKAIKKYVQRAAEVLESGAASAENHQLITRGKAQAFELMIANMKTLHDMELAKMKSKREAEVEDSPESPRSRPVGVAPGKTLKERRLEEERMAASESSPVNPVEIVEPVKTTKPKPEKPKPKKSSVKRAANS